MKNLKFLTAALFSSSLNMIAQDSFDLDNDLDLLEVDAQDKALKKLQPASDLEDAVSLIKTYFDNAVNRVCSVRLAKEAEFQKNFCDKALQNTSDLAKINQLRKDSVKMNTLKNSVVASHDDVLVKEKRVYVIKSLGTNSVYKSKKAQFDNVFARLEVLVKKTFDDLTAKANELMLNPRVASTAYLKQTYPIIKSFLQESASLRNSLEISVRPAVFTPATSVVAPVATDVNSVVAQ